MAKRYQFHGAFGSKDSARVKAKEVKGTVREITVRGKTRYVVSSEK